jgi:hypothetical protein
MTSRIKTNAVGIAALALGLAALAIALRRRRKQKPKATIKLLDADPVMGQEKYLGGVEGGNGLIYCIPGHARRVLVINPKTDEVSYIGPEFSGKYKWLRGVLAQDGERLPLCLSFVVVVVVVVASSSSSC